MTKLVFWHGWGMSPDVWTDFMKDLREVLPGVPYMTPCRCRDMRVPACPTAIAVVMGRYPDGRYAGADRFVRLVDGSCSGIVGRLPLSGEN